MQIFSINLYFISSGDPQATAGKCSHGGLEDESRFFVAKCGINKDTTDKEFSPHYHLHYNAYDAAVEATKQFLIGEGYKHIFNSDCFCRSNKFDTIYLHLNA